MKSRIILPLLAAFCLSASLHAQSSCDDDSHISSDFSQFASELRHAVAHRDLPALRNLTGDSITATWGDQPADSLLKIYFGDPKADWAWEQVEKAMNAGFWNITDSSWSSIYRCDSVFTSPAYLRQVPAYNEVIIVGDDVPVMQKPGSSGPELDRVGCMLAALNESPRLLKYLNGKSKWVPVYLTDGRTGFVHEKYTSFSISFEVMAGKVNGVWRLIGIFEPLGC